MSNYQSRFGATNPAFRQPILANTNTKALQMTNISSATNTQTIARFLQNSVMTAVTTAPLSARVVSTGQNNIVPMRPISAYSDAELDSLEHNYRKSARISGGAYTLHEVMNEKSKRATGGLGGKQLVSLILELSCQSQDGFTTYADLWAALYPAKPWCGNKTVRAIMEVMDIAILHCVDNGLPIVTTLIVRSDTRKQSANAVTNIYNAARMYGVAVGTSEEDFVTMQILESFDLAQASKTFH